MIRRLAVAAMLILSVPLVAGFLNGVHPAFDSMAHFRLHLAVLLALAALPLLVSRWRAHAALALLLAAGAGLSARGAPELGIGPVHAGFRERQPEAHSYRLLHLNLRFDHREPERVLDLLAEVKPDFVLFNEVSEMWAGRLRGLLNAYPYQLRCGRREQVGGVALLSRLPFSPERMNRCADDGAMAMATLDLDGRLVDLAALHLEWPWPYGQHAQIAELSPLLQTLGANAILAGDLNAAPWSDAAGRVAAAGRLTPMQPVGPTWLVRWLPSALRPWMGLPIDQVYAKGDVVLHSGRALNDAGSDHLPVLVEFSLRATEISSEQMIAALP